jgi:hypothetical protein
MKTNAAEPRRLCRAGHPTKAAKQHEHRHSHHDLGITASSA